MRFALPVVAGAFSLLACHAQAAEFVTVPLEIAIDRPADIAWKKLSGFCDIGGWMKTTCVYTSGSGEVGTVRRIAGRIDELLVAKTAWSYSYAQPQSPIDYHGTVEIRPDGRRASKLFYTLVYDAESLKTSEARAADIAYRTKLFTGVLSTMKAIAEAK